MSDPISFIKSLGGNVDAAIVDQMGYAFAHSAVMSIVNASNDNKAVPALLMDGYYLYTDGSIKYNASYGLVLVNPIPLKYGETIYFGLKRTSGGIAKLHVSRLCEYASDGTFLAYTDGVTEYTPQHETAAYIMSHVLHDNISDAAYIFAGYDENAIINDNMAAWSMADSDARAMLTDRTLLTKNDTISDLNNATSGIHFVQTGTNNTPVVSAGMLVDCVNPTSPNYSHYQIYVTYDTCTVYSRVHRGNEWSTWEHVSVINPFFEPSASSNISDANTVDESGMYWCGGASEDTGGTVNTPGDFSGCLLNFRSSNPNNRDFRTYQLFIRYDRQAMWFRNMRGTGTWSEWTMLPTASDMSYGITNIAWFGDSISALKTLPDDVAENFGAKVYDCSCPGATLVNQAPGNEPYETLGFKGLMQALHTGDYSAQDQAVKDLASQSGTNFTINLNNFKSINWAAVDTAVILYGTNDYYHGVMSIDDWKSGFKNELSTLMRDKPHVQVFVITPMYREDGGVSNKQGKVLTDYVQALVEVCRDMNVPCYDLYHGSCINNLTSDTYLGDDGLHPNDMGNVLLTEKITKFLMSN